MGKIPLVPPRRGEPAVEVARGNGESVPQGHCGINVADGRPGVDERPADIQGDGPDCGLAPKAFGVALLADCGLRR
jgi:hypothetical protein